MYCEYSQREITGIVSIVEKVFRLSRLDTEGARSSPAGHDLHVQSILDDRCCLDSGTGMSLVRLEIDLTGSSPAGHVLRAK